MNSASHEKTQFKSGEQEVDANRNLIQNTKTLEFFYFAENLRSKDELGWETGWAAVNLFLPDGKVSTREFTDSSILRLSLDSPPD